MHWQEIEKQSGVAVITGGASGVGFASAAHLASKGFRIMLADVNEIALEQAAKKLRSSGADVRTCQTDVASSASVDTLALQAFEWGPVTVLMNNAGIAAPTTTWGKVEDWRRLFDVNLYGVLNGLHAFVPKFLEAGLPAAIINTGSKQGITNPPGNPGYNATKAAVKSLTEHLAHDLRELHAPIDVHHFVPGFTYTEMIASFMPEKPASAWTSEQTVEYLFERIASGDFHILCPDNAVTEEIDAHRVLWNAQDITENRPALSRWHTEWIAKFSEREESSK